MRALHDGGDRLVDLESLSDRHASLWAETVRTQTEKGRGNKIGMIGMLLPNTVTKRGYKKMQLQRGGNKRKEGLT